MTHLKSVATALGLMATVAMASSPQAQDLQEQRELVNQGTVTVLGGSISGTYSKLIWDMATLFDDGYELRVLPVLGKGSLRGVEDLLLLKGIDVALLQSDVMDFMVNNNVYPDIESRLRYITVLFNEEVHLVARKTISSIEELRGKKVSFGPSSSGGFMTASIVFDALGIEPEIMDLSHQEGLEQLRRGEIDALVRVAGAPVKFLQEVTPSDGLHIVPIPQIEGAYLEATVTSDQYSALIPAGGEVSTIAVGAIMAAYNWTDGHPRRIKVQRFVDQFGTRVDELRTQPFHDKWQQVDLTKKLPGWTRWEPVPVPPQS